MAKFPTDVDESVTIAAPRERVYAYLWDVVGASHCVPDVATCERVGPDTYRFVSQERSAGPVSMVARYTARYEGNGLDTIRFESLPLEGENTDVRGVIALEGAAEAGASVRTGAVWMISGPPTTRTDPTAGRAAGRRAVSNPVEDCWRRRPRRCRCTRACTRPSRTGSRCYRRPIRSSACRRATSRAGR
jgi:hypothetical protein